ncbi:MAG: hypothetical protein K8R59_01570, partial [Thermoanaerobaculales bacterium]|nr:hypothetical protein [Thermoanaerobaculales bacterium]
MQRERNLFHWALIVSLLLHLIILLLVVPGVRQAWPQPPVPIFQIPPEPESDVEPIRFEFVDLAEDREEKPTDPDEALYSDMDRRAHGGEGQQAPSA